MALTQEIDQRLAKVGLDVFFENNRPLWMAMAQRTYNFLRADFPVGAVVRPDDVAEVLVPLVRVNKLLQDRLSVGSLTQKFWVTFFVDLIIDRVWRDIAGAN